MGTCWLFSSCRKSSLLDLSQSELVLAQAAPSSLHMKTWQPGPGALRAHLGKGSKLSGNAPCPLAISGKHLGRCNLVKAFSLVSASVLLGEYSSQLPEEKSPRECKALTHYHTRHGRRQRQGLVSLAPWSTLVSPSHEASTVQCRPSQGLSHVPTVAVQPRSSLKLSGSTHWPLDLFNPPNETPR